jgi:transposase
MRAYSEDLRDRVISKYKTGKYKIIELAKLFNIERHTISSWIRRYKETGDYSSKQHYQTGKVIKFNDRNKVLEYLSINPNADGKTIKNNVAPGLAMSTFYDALSRMKITYKKRTKLQI